MRLIGLSGWSGSGKTTLIAALIPVLASRGHTVSTVKHAHHGFDIDRPGKDSHLHREAGAHEVLVASGTRWALMHEHRDTAEPPLSDLLARLEPVDLVLIEGFKRDPHPKIEVYRAELGKPLLYPEDAHIVAIASAPLLGDTPLPNLDLNDISAIAGLIEQQAAPLDAIGWTNA